MVVESFSVLLNECFAKSVVKRVVQAAGEQVIELAAEMSRRVGC